MKKVKISFVGDISFGDFPFCSGFGIRSSIESGSNPLQSISHKFLNSDLVVGNLESVISDYNLNSNQVESWEMRGAPISAPMLKEAGFTHVNMANNHTMQHGAHAFMDTVHNLEKTGILSFGVERRNGNLVIERVGNLDIGFLGYAFENDIYGNEQVLYVSGNQSDVLFEISEARKQVDYLFVSCHWGVEFISYPSPSTIILARKMVERGADFVIGHHPHCIQVLRFTKTGIFFTAWEIFFLTCFGMTNSAIRIFLRLILTIKFI